MYFSVCILASLTVLMIHLLGWGKVLELSRGKGDRMRERDTQRGNRAERQTKIKKQKERRRGR